MTEKRDLNNELILMKKTIQQAKVCVIGKLVRKLKNLTNRPGKELSGLKLIGKKGRLTDQINYLKKTPALELATLSLTFNKDPLKILTNQLSSIEDASLASIVTFKTVNENVNQIKAKFSLNENGDDWRETVTGIGKKKKKKIEKETNKSRNKERKEAHKKQKELVKKRDEWLEEHIDPVDESADETEVTDDEDLPQKPAVKRVKREKSASILSLTEKPAKTKSLATKKPAPVPLKTADPFFLTGTGETYLATKVIERVQPRGPIDGLDRKERRAQKLSGTPKPTPRRREIREMPSGPTGFVKPNVIPTDLHPSWAAKMKSKGIDKFQGKRMKFHLEAEEEAANVAVVVSKSSSMSQRPAPKNDDEKIHPSWAAKQKLKPVISEFKGSKIVFDE